ncbi:adenosylcobinamide-phosphate synthase CbiB [Chitinispirillales bacterium ANBcel5]|uniref:adenosylcobinamide-phosphate synthase CbiB n=1 Tax=Cellulosispirillum alkaliphilum TaxID=3039283 RepID=UPI002A591DB5|nr:adenosylcobinamide-phosphate synthase CbiB [Chitinispirillales bacterium ANBcel5]
MKSSVFQTGRTTEMHPLSLTIAFLLDLLVGDPRWLPHPVRWIGSLILFLEKKLYPNGQTSRKEFLCGVLLTVIVICCVLVLSFLLIKIGQFISPFLTIAIESILGFFCLSARSLSKESLLVLKYLKAGDLLSARTQLSMIVGRDTVNLNEEQIVRASVETVGENITDGIIAPLFYLAIGGPILCLIYKAVSTMDSMIGYKNERYKSFGTCAAKIDDLLNFIPARLTGFLLIPVASLCCGLNGWRSFIIMKRDRHKHESPNSAHGESAVAGALGIQLGGTSTYGGIVSQKPFLGDPLRTLSLNDIVRANAVLFSVAILSFLLAVSWLLLVSRGV